jgi:hypothetical protein
MDPTINELMRLYAIPRNEKFSEGETEFIFSELKKVKVNHRVKYGIYKKPSKFNAQIAVIIDTMCNSSRRSGAENNFDFVCERQITDLELHELAENWGCNTRRFICYYYKTIDALIVDDKKYNIDTPHKFVVVAEKFKKNYHTQLKIF